MKKAPKHVVDVTHLLKEAVENVAREEDIPEQEVWDQLFELLKVERKQ